MEENKSIMWIKDIWSFFKEKCVVVLKKFGSWLETITITIKLKKMVEENKTIKKVIKKTTNKKVPHIKRSTKKKMAKK